MKQEYYKELSNKLHRPSDIDKLQKETGLDRELLLIIYSQRTTRDATRRYYQIKREARRLRYQWRKGKSLMQIAAEKNFPPILIGLMVLEEEGINKKDFWKHVHEPDHIVDSRLRGEIKEITKKDILYSPAGSEVQKERGILGEKLLDDWLKKHGLVYEFLLIAFVTDFRDKIFEFGIGRFAKRKCAFANTMAMARSTTQTPPSAAINTARWCRSARGIKVGSVTLKILRWNYWCVRKV